MLIAITGLPGSGKSTFARDHFNASAQPGARVRLFETDELFYQMNLNGSKSYVFDPAKLAEYHMLNQRRVKRWLEVNPTGVAVVANTFSQHWELETYIGIACETRHQVRVYYCDPAPLTLEDLAEHNIHGVPLETIKAMKDRWEPIPAAITVYPYGAKR